MRIRVVPGASVGGTVRVPGDKSVAHRWLVLAATARGRSHLSELPAALDVRSTAACLASLTIKAAPALDLWSRLAPSRVEGGGSTWNEGVDLDRESAVELEGEGRAGLVAPTQALDCGNSGTSMRMLSGIVASAPFSTVLVGDDSLSVRPMERVAAPLRLMGAEVRTTDGHAPITIQGRQLHGIRYETPVPSAQVKSAVLLAGLDADGETAVVEPAPTRDHTERALAALGAPIRTLEGGVALTRFQHEGFAAKVPGDPSSAAFLIAAAALTGSAIVITDVGLNPSRLRFLDVLGRMGVPATTTSEREELGEPVGTIEVGPCDGLRGVRVEEDELPSIVDEVPVLAAIAAHARGESWFLGAGELRVKESDRLAAVTSGIRALGGEAADEGNDLVLPGGGLRGGHANAGGDHRMAMSLAVAALAADGPSEVDGIEAADVSFPGFVQTLRGLGAEVSG
ncbi:MAG: 3-phosphoshikimate 1-carboxyvinyltransferase [Actinomycetota bacterium]